jgi:hypothetical protein
MRKCVGQPHGAEDVAQRVNKDLAAHEEIRRLDDVFAVSVAELEMS